MSQSYIQHAANSRL